MTPEELKRLMETIERRSYQSKADEIPMVWEEPPEVRESLKTMKAVHERLQQLIEHDRQKLKDSEKLLSEINDGSRNF